MPRALACVGILAMVACVSPSRRESGDRLVGAIPADVTDWWYTISADGSTAAYAERRGSNAYVDVGGRRYGPYT